MCTVQAALELSLRGLLAAASGDNGDGGSDSTPSGDGGSPGDGTLGGGDAAWREGCEELEELEELEEQLATLRLQLHIADDVLQQRRQSPRMVETPPSSSPARSSQQPVRSPIVPRSPSVCSEPCAGPEWRAPAAWMPKREAAPALWPKVTDTD